VRRCFGAIAAVVLACSSTPQQIDPLPPPPPSRSASPARSASITPTPRAATTPLPTSLARGDGSPADAKLAEGDKAYDADDYSAAAGAYLEAAKLAPGDPAPLVGYARSILLGESVPSNVDAARDNPTAVEAANVLRKAIGLDSSYALAQRDLGRVLLTLGDVGDAMAPLSFAAELAPGDPETMGSLGLAQLLTRQIEPGLNSLRRAAELDPTDARRHANLGTVLLQLGEGAAALAAYKRALQLEPQSAHYQTNLGSAYLKLRDVDKALPYLEKAVALEPKRATFLSNLGYAYGELKRYDDAIARLEQATKLNSKLVSAWINLGNVYARQGKLSQARQIYDRARAIEPDNISLREVMKELEALEKAKP